MKNSIYETQKVRWDWDEDDEGNIAEQVVIDDKKYIDVDYFNQKMCENTKEIETLRKALTLAREYMFNVMCADDVPFEEWFIKCAKNNWKSY